MDTSSIIAIAAVVVFMCAMGGLILYANTPPKSQPDADEAAKPGDRR